MLYYLLKLALRTSKIRSLFPGDMWLCPKRGYPKIQRCIISFLQQYHHVDVFFPYIEWPFLLSMPPISEQPHLILLLSSIRFYCKKTYPMTSPHSIFLQNAWLQAQQATQPLVVFLRPGHVRPHLDSACSDGHG